MGDMGITEPMFYEGTNKIYEDYTVPNFSVYLVDGGQHCFTQDPLFYTASTAGTDSPATGSIPMLYEWVANLVKTTKGSTECSGDMAANGANSTTYCDESLVNKDEA